MPPREITFILCFDFDGTLAYPAHAPPFHPRTLEYFKALRAAGAAWVVNSGRGLANLITGLGENGVFLLPDYIIANEYEIYEPNLLGSWDAMGGWNRQVDHDQRLFHRIHNRLLRDLQRWIQAEVPADMLQDETGSWGVVAETTEIMDTICTRIGLLQAENPDLGYHRNGRHLRFSHASYDKGAALHELCRLLGVLPERTFSAGDNHNDVPMLSPDVARFRACPSNAEEEVKSLLRGTGGLVAKQDASLGMMEAMRYFFGANLDEAGITVEGRDPALGL